MTTGKKVICKGSFELDIYKCTVDVIVVSNSKEVTNKARQIFKKGGGELDSEDASHGYAIALDSKYYIILALEGLTVNTIAHEIDHIRWYVMKGGGISADSDDTTEVSASLSGYITEKVFQILTNNSIKINFA